MINSILIQDVDLTGASISLEPLNPTSIVYLKPLTAPPITMSGSWDITFTSDPMAGFEITFAWIGGTIILDPSFTFQVDNTVITQEMLDTDGAVVVKVLDYSGTRHSVYTPNFNTTSVISGTTLIDGTVPLNKLVDITPGNVILGDAGGVPTETTLSGDITVDSAGVTAIGAKKVLEANFEDSTPGYMLVVNNSNRPVYTPITGAINIDGTGLATIPAGSINPDAFSFNVGVPVQAQVTLSSAEILALNSTPIEVVAAPGIGRSIVVMKATLDCTYLTTPYATNTTIWVYTDSATVPQAANNCLDFTVSREVSLDIGSNVFSASDTQIIANQPLMVSVDTGDPTAGDGTAILTVYYVIK